MTLHENLKDARNHMGMSQELVAEQLGVSRQAVTKWELGQSKPSAKNLKALAELYQIPSEELLTAAKKDGPNLILRANLTKLAISLQIVFLNLALQNEYMRRYHPEDNFYQSGLWRGALVVWLIVVALCSTWMATNHRFETNMNQRRKNNRIEFFYCLIQVLSALIVIVYWGHNFLGMLLMLVIYAVYILYINPKFMNRKLTR